MGNLPNAAKLFCDSSGFQALIRGRTPTSGYLVLRAASGYTDVHPQAPKPRVLVGWTGLLTPGAEGYQHRSEDIQRLTPRPSARLPLK